MSNEDRQVIDLCDQNNFRRAWADDVEREQEMCRITGMARRIAKKRRHIYRAAMWGCYLMAGIGAAAFGRLMRYDLPIPGVLAAIFCILLTACAFHFDSESRRES